ncbi:MAG: NAD(P)/FAD-dependent oxidoreductase [Candidatus Sumerlaeota bacterium]|nr:NAD(P)/FAD-dependent oxidoreductase [Candidatus Sumerlaeota bacterium]
MSAVQEKKNASSSLIIAGAGAAGLMAAGQAAAAGLGPSVLLLEKMERPARKLRITGKGRCNLTNLAPLPDFLEHFGHNGRFLRPAFSAFFAPDLIAFFESLGIRTIVERGGRVFPESQEAQDVVDAMVDWARGQGARIQTGCAARRLMIENGRIQGIETCDGRRRAAQAVILATGGASYPATGSTGDGYAIAEAAGHALIPIRPALAPLETAGDLAQRMQGVSLRNVTARLLVDGKKQAEEFGEMLFTHFGLSGPIILTLSGQAVDALRAGRKTAISVDLKPALDEEKLDARLRRDLDAHGKRTFQNLLKDLLPAKVIPACIAETGVAQEKMGHQITSEERRRLRLWLKDLRFEITGHRPLSEAIITAGGVATREVNPNTMESRLVKGLYFAGELLDVDADTGGYNLQAAFSTGYLAGRSAALELISAQQA